MKMQTIRIGVASILAATMIGTGWAAPKADAAGAKPINFNVQTHYINYESLNNIAQKYGIDLDKLNIKFNGIVIKWPSFGGSVPTKPTQPPVTPTPTTKPTQPPVTPTPTTKPTQPPVTPTPTTKPTQPPVTPAPTTKPTQPPVTPTPTQTPAPETGTLQSQVVALVNQERAKLGLPALQTDSLLNKVATEKARDMDVNNYFSHTSPTYGSPFDMMRTYGVKYSYAGENIASGQRSAAQVMNDWMNSPGHRANIVNGNFTKIGVGYVNGKWVQMFIG
ncbi:CAP domain-containing protein [Paenibacillus paeoniae]|uniref:SCP-like extracellular n=1 Tax=Paenibacillus paeoniae TaxID=2292705 RepID=A0A371PFB5_9BACL|nr:CAP domain-containing protein [Paenibacillus paeoniae]REK74631.1 SCP-like extracellular [Paenibacillus paeoniae]